MKVLKNYMTRYKIRHIVCIIFEEYIGFFFRYWPGYEGFLFRRFFYKLMFKKLGSEATIHSNVLINHSYGVVAGDYFAINSGSFLDGRGGIVIGDYVLIGPNVFVGSATHINEPKFGAPRSMVGHINEPVKIGSNVWIGANSVICPGVTIGNNAIIAAGSIVTKDIPQAVLVSGNPAIIKRELSVA